ncbi:MAG TPA: hypothetical protein VEZ44_16345 [bacterium]|nr:hypothetical protein [bacterium]
MPHCVRAKFECRLVPNQTYRGVLDKVRRHLDRRGYADIQIVAVRGGRLVEEAHGHEWARFLRRPAVRPIWSRFHTTRG